jgi:hypothetical protein
MAKVWYSKWSPGGHKLGQITISKKSLGVLPKGILTPSFIEIAPAVTKRALLTDNDNGDECHGALLKMPRRNTIYATEAAPADEWYLLHSLCATARKICLWWALWHNDEHEEFIQDWV